MKKILAIVLSVITLSFCLTGCVYEDLSVKLNKDETGSIAATIGLKKDFVDQMMNGQNPFDGKETKEIEYDGDKYQQWSMDSLMNCTLLAFRSLVEGKKITDISLITENDEKNIAKYNATERQIERTDLVSAFKKKAEQYRQIVAIVSQIALKKTLPQ